MTEIGVASDDIVLGRDSARLVTARHCTATCRRVQLAAGADIATSLASAQRTD